MVLRSTKYRVLFWNDDENFKFGESTGVHRHARFPLEMKSQNIFSHLETPSLNTFQASSQNRPLGWEAVVVLFESLGAESKLQNANNRHKAFSKEANKVLSYLNHLQDRNHSFRSQMTTNARFLSLVAFLFATSTTAFPSPRFIVPRATTARSALAIDASAIETFFQTQPYVSAFLTCSFKASAADLMVQTKAAGESADEGMDSSLDTATMQQPDGEKKGRCRPLSQFGISALWRHLPRNCSAVHVFHGLSGLVWRRG